MRIDIPGIHMSGEFLSIIRGDTHVYRGNVAVDNVAQNIAGAEVVFLALRHPDCDDEANAVINVSSNSSNSNSAGSIALDGANSERVTLTFSEDNTNSYDPEPMLYWSVRARLPNGNRYTLDKGRMDISNVSSVGL